MFHHSEHDHCAAFYEDSSVDGYEYSGVLAFGRIWDEVFWMRSAYPFVPQWDCSICRWTLRGSEPLLLDPDIECFYRLNQIRWASESSTCNHWKSTYVEWLSPEKLFIDHSLIIIITAVHSIIHPAPCARSPASIPNSSVDILLGSIWSTHLSKQFLIVILNRPASQYYLIL